MNDDGSPAMGRALVCRVGGLLCALPFEQVVESMRPLPVESLPGAPPFVRGLSMIRGVPVPVVDLAAALGTGNFTDPTRFVSIRVGQRHVALAVEGVLGVRDLPASSLRELPPLLGEAGAGVIAAIGALDSAFLLVVQAARIVPEALWESLEPRAPS